MSSGSEPGLIPLFPLHTVLFPGGLLPLHIFEERYRLLVQERRDFGVVLIREGREVGAGQGDDIHRIGTLATLQQVEALQDGRYNVIARGLGRFRVLALEHGRPYLMGQVEVLPEPATRGGQGLLTLLDSYLAAYGLEVAPQLSAAAGKRAVWLVGSVLQVEPQQRQGLLESADPALAEELLQSELARLAKLGRLAPMPHRPPSPN